MSRLAQHWPSREFCWDCVRQKVDYLRDRHEFDLVAATDPERDTCRREFAEWVESDPEPPVQPE